MNGIKAWLEGGDVYMYLIIEVGRSGSWSSNPNNLPV